MKSQLAVKRITDLLISLIALIVLSPLLCLIAICIKFTSKGPVLFCQNRIGHGERLFVFLKFRSMIHDQQRIISEKEVDSLKRRGILYKQPNDPRITTIGHILRKTSIDELPQLINVLKGDMSIVGPRPLIPFMLEHLPEFKRRRSLVRPGLTGLWQVRDRMNNTKAEYMIKHDLEYVDSFSLFLDFKIILFTIPLVIKGKGAH